jgi:tetratricopeptide (TPR) repeat protein
VVETARAGLPGPERGSTHRWPMPPTVQQVIAGRLEQVSAPARALAGVAATIGRAFTFEVLARATGQDEDTLVQELDELWRRRVVRQQGAAGYDFSHDKIREVAYGELTAARRRWLHRRVAAALEAVHAGDLDPVSGQIAMHYQRAGQPKHAINYYRLAAEAAKRIYANREAIGFFRKAVDLLESVATRAHEGEAEHKMAAELYEGMGDVLSLTGQHDEAWMAYQNALAHVPEDDPIWLARLTRQMGNAHASQYRLDEALQTYQRAEAALGPEPSQRVSEWQQEWLAIQIDHMWLYYYWNQPQKIGEMEARLHPVLEKHGSLVQRRQVLSLLGARNLRVERYVISRETLIYTRRTLEIAQELDDVGMRAHSRFLLGFVLLFHGNLDSAEAELRTGLRLASQIGDLNLQIQCQVYLAILQRKRGRLTAVKELSSESLALTSKARGSVYEATVHANLAWVAWQQGRAADVTAHGQEALAQWERWPAYPFKWTALWPLLAVALAQDRIDEAVEHARGLLDPAQQALPAALSTALDNALQAWDANERPLARCHLSTAVELAAQHDYI